MVVWDRSELFSNLANPAFLTGLCTAPGPLMSTLTLAIVLGTMIALPGCIDAFAARELYARECGSRIASRPRADGRGGRRNHRDEPVEKNDGVLTHGAVKELLSELTGAKH